MEFECIRRMLFPSVASDLPMAERAGIRQLGLVPGIAGRFLVIVSMFTSALVIVAVVMFLLIVIAGIGLVGRCVAHGSAHSRDVTAERHSGDARTASEQ
jgi:hypothetical protein